MPVPSAVAAAIGQTWPPFALVAGLLLAGAVANRDGVFATVAAWLARTPGGTVPLYAVSMAVVAATTVVLNLDTSVAFLTPVLAQLARRRQAVEAPFVYGCVYMSNAASLLLPGSNLTNLLVFAVHPVAGTVFARDMAAGWAAAVLVTATLTFFLCRLSGRQSPPHAGMLANQAGAGTRRQSDPSASLNDRGRGTLGWLAVCAVVLFMLLLAEPALPVLGAGLLAAAIRLARREMSVAQLVRAVNPFILGGLFLVACALGVVGRLWKGPRTLMRAAGSWQTAAIGAVAAVLVNNLPAAVLLSSSAVPHARSLLLGLNIGPNLAVTGSLSAVIWLQVARSSGAAASAWCYSMGGLVIVPCSLAAALAAFSLSGSPQL